MLILFYDDCVLYVLIAGGMSLGGGCVVLALLSSVVVVVYPSSVGRFVAPELRVIMHSIY